MPTRAEVVIFRSAFNYCSEVGTFKLSLKEIEKGIGISVEQQLWERIGPSLIKVSQARFDFVKPDFMGFMKYICPWAQAMHLRMFEDWCHQYDELEEQKHLNEEIEDVAEIFLENEKKAVMPMDELNMIENDFNDMDQMKRGYITIEELARAWDMDPRSLKEMLVHHNLSEDAYVDKQSYFRLVCPEHYRLPEMSGSERDLFGKLILCTTRRLSREIHDQERLFLDKEMSGKIAPMPMSLLPEVEESDWDAWNAAFTRLDKGKDDNLDMADLVNSGLLSEEVCSFLCGMLGDIQEQCFSRHAFLSALLEVHNVRRHGFVNAC